MCLCVECKRECMSPRRTESSGELQGVWVTQCRCWYLKPGPVPGQYTLWAPESSFQFRYCKLYKELVGISGNKGHLFFGGLGKDKLGLRGQFGATGNPVSKRKQPKQNKKQPNKTNKKQKPETESMYEETMQNLRLAWANNNIPQKKSEIKKKIKTLVKLFVLFWGSNSPALASQALGFSRYVPSQPAHLWSSCNSLCGFSLRCLVL